jgi:hypothetical protein
MKVVRSSPLRTGRLYPQEYPGTQFYIYIYIYRVIKNDLTIHNTLEIGVYVFFLFNRTIIQVFVTYLTGALYVHPLWFYKHQHDIRVRSTQNAFSLPFAAMLVNCAPSGEMHNYCTPHIIKENWEFLDPSVQLHNPISSVLCMTSC